MSILYRLFLARRWWLMLLPVVVCLPLIAVDTRFAYVALIVAMGVIIVSLPLMWYYALTQESRWSILEKTLTLTREGVQLDFTSEKMNRHVIAWEEMTSTTAHSECLVIRLKKNRYTFLAIPLSAFKSKEELRRFVLDLNAGIAESVGR